jgi:hypothetical protein
MFRLSAEDALNRSHFATGSQKHRDPRSPPFAFTKQGATMAATVLNSPRSDEMGIYVVRAFVQMREWISSSKVSFLTISRRLDNRVTSAPPSEHTERQRDAQTR